jgi:hypothetical protein
MRGALSVHRFEKACLGLVAAVGLLGLLTPAAAGAAVGVGQTFTPSGGAAACGNDYTWLEYPVPTDGLLTSWSFLADASPPQLKFKLARPTATPNRYTVVAESSLKSPVANQLNTFPIQVPAQAGDLIGFYTATMNDCLRGISTGPTTYVLQNGEAALNVPTTFTPTTDQLDLSAALEPNPETSITAHPKKRTRRARSRFVFTSSVPGSTFECSLDGKPFVTCASPDAFKVKRGRHTFSVRARGPLGNADSTPAMTVWRVRKKRL